jgi:hypothetical protein
MTLPHKIYINDTLLGILTTPKLCIKDIPEGQYQLKIQSMVPFLTSSATIDIVKDGENTVTFSDRERFWNLLFVIDMVLIILSWIIGIPPEIKHIYDIITSGYLVIWLLYEWSIRKKYFKIVQTRKDAC